MLAVVANASVILMLRELIAAPLSYVRESLTSPASLALVVSGLDEASPIARFFGTIDVFALWWVVVLAIGTGIAWRVRARRLAVVFLGVYLGVALILAGAMASLGGTG
jgi:hypothetical protein